jgi:hypothetical protein
MNYPGPEKCSRCGRGFELIETTNYDGATVSYREIAMVLTVDEGYTDRYKPGDYGFCVPCMIDAFLRKG